MLAPALIDTDKLRTLQMSLQQQRQQQPAQQLSADSRVLLLAASQLSIELLPSLYHALESLPAGDHLDVVLYSRGGVVNGVRRLALLLHEYTQHLTFIVPHYCESSATLMCLAGQTLITGPLSVFSPIDPQLQAESADSSLPASLSAQDVRLFPQALGEWFGLADDDSTAFALQQLAQSIFPTTLTSFYRANQELEAIARELLQRSGTVQAEHQQQTIIQQLLYGYHSHSYAITDTELSKLGLPVQRCFSSDQESSYRQALALVEQLRPQLGAGARADAQQPWCDTLIATSALQVSRWHQADSLQAQWQLRLEDQQA